MKYSQFDAIEHMAKAMKFYDETTKENFTWRDLAGVAYIALEKYKFLVENDAEHNQKER